MTNANTSYSPVSLEKSSKSQGLVIKEGDFFKIKCQADGNPIPKIDWFHNGAKIEDNKFEDIQIQINGKLSTLIISKVKVKHGGNYSCTAHNNNGVLSKWAYVSVLRKYSVTTAASNTTAVKVCSQETCVFGSCIRKNNSSHCKCPPSYGGVNCDYQAERINQSEPCITFQNNKDYSFTENKLFALISFGLLIVLVLLLISLMCFYKFKKRRGYIHGTKSKQFVNAATQVSGIFDSELNLSHIPDNISSSIVNFDKPFVNNYQYNDTPPYNSFILQKNPRGPPSGQSCSSQETSMINPNLIPKNILVSVSDNSYSMYNTSTINSNYCITQLPPQMMRLHNTTRYLCPSLETENNLTLNNYIGNIIPLPFSCNDPCCCLNVDSKTQLTSAFQSDFSKPSIISPHTSLIDNSHICTCKCNIQSINTFV